MFRCTVIPNKVRGGTWGTVILYLSTWCQHCFIKAFPLPYLSALTTGCMYCIILYKCDLNIFRVKLHHLKMNFDFSTRKKCFSNKALGEGRGSEFVFLCSQEKNQYNTLKTQRRKRADACGCLDWVPLLCLPDSRLWSPAVWAERADWL